MKVNIRRTPKENGAVGIKGDAVYGDVKIRFNIHKNSPQKIDTGGAPYVLVVNLVDPVTGNILQKGGRAPRLLKEKIEKKLAEVKEDENLSDAQRKKKEELYTGKLERLKAGLPLEELNATASSYLREISDAVVKKNVEHLGKKLYGENFDSISKALKQSPEAGELSARSAFDIYQNDFFRSLRVVKPQTQAERKNALEQVCNELEGPIGNLTNRDVAKAIGTLSQSKQKRNLNLIEAFFAYSGENKAYSGPNPITRYRDRLSVEKGRAGKSHKDPSTHVEPEADRKLHDSVQQQIVDGNPMCLAIPLAKCFRATMDQIINFTWKDVEIVDGQVYIRDYHSEYSGGTLNYLRPPLAEGTRFLLDRYNTLVKTAGKTKLKMCRLVDIPCSVKEQKAALSKYFQEELYRAGVSKDRIKDAADPGKKTAAGGAGYALLIKHYDYVLENQCGVDLESGLGCYLSGRRIYDTTTDYYRCLSDGTGKHSNGTIVRRDGYAEADPNMGPAPTVDVGDERYFVFDPAGANAKIGVISKGKVFVPKGSVVCFSAFRGVDGSARFTAAEGDSAADRYVIL